MAVDRADGAEYRYSVETDDGETVPVELADDLPTAAANGAIEAEVVDPESSSPQLAEATATSASEAASAPAPTAHRAYVVRVTGGVGGVGGVKDVSLASTGQTKAALCAMNRPELLWNRAAREFQHVRLEPTAADPSPTQNHLIVLVSGCMGANDPLGVGTVGASIADGGASTLSWDPSYVDATGVQELGHNLGLGHANIRSCTACAALEYADVYSVMGFGIPGAEPPALDSAFRDRLGITQPGEVRALQLGDGILFEATTVQLSPRGLPSGTRAVSVIDPMSGARLWVEFRIGFGRDAGSAYPFATISGYQFFEGVTVTELDDNGELDLLPQTPRTAGTDVGSTFRNETGGVALDVNDGSGDDPRVTFTLQRGVPKIVTGGTGGSARVGAAASADIAGWPPDTAFTHSWRIGDTEVSSGETHTPLAASRGQQVRLAIVATPPGEPSQTRTSAPVTIGYGKLVGPALRTSGTLKVGSTLRAVSTSVATAPSSTYSYRWYRSTAPISGAVKSSYRLTSADKGQRIRVKVVARRTGYAQLISSSPYVGPTR